MDVCFSSDDESVCQIRATLEHFGFHSLISLQSTTHVRQKMAAVHFTTWQYLVNLHVTMANRHIKSDTVYFLLIFHPYTILKQHSVC